MATIRMSASLQNEIIRNVDNMFVSRLQAAKTAAEQEVSKHAEEALTTLIPKTFLDFIEKEGQAASTYLELTRQLYISYRIDNLAFSSCFTYSRHIPALRLRYYEISPTKYPELYKKIAELQAPYVAVIKEKQELLAQTKELLGKVVTFKQLLSAWPSAIEFVSEDTKKRHYAKQTYTKRASELVQLDEKIKANLLKARIASDIGKS